MKKATSICYIILVMALLLVPFVGMFTGFRTDETTENKTLAEFPSITTREGSFSSDFLSELGDYFDDHFAFREALVNADALVQSTVFATSNVDTVVVGTEGWLYYTATVADYQGTSLMSERSLYNAAYNLKLIEDYVESTGATFAVAIPANKNTLYGENMPYYYSSASDSAKSNIVQIKSAFESLGVNYADLLTVFQASNETLYLKTDSHWNNRGAVLAYNTILDTIEVEHDYLDTVSALRTESKAGDLAIMIFPLTYSLDWDYDYDYTDSFTYATDTESVEDAFIQTTNASGNGTLLMYRDSFGNTLLPLMANVFESAVFSKGTPYAIQSYVEEYGPTAVVIEKVERNISDFANEAPLMETVACAFDAEVTVALDETTCVVSEGEYDTSYVSFAGVLEENADITAAYVELTLGDTIKVYPAFMVSTDDTDYGYICYIKKDTLAAFAEGETEVDVRVIVASKAETLSVVNETTFDISTFIN